MSDDREPLRAWLDLLGTSTAIRKGVDARLRECFGLSLSRFDVLAALDRAGPEGLTGRGLSVHLKVTEGNTTQVTSPLVADGLVSRTVSAEDGRVAIFQLTARGRRLFARMAQENRRWIGAAFAALSPAEIAALRRLLAALKPPALATSEEAA
jgi:DNA-binding MarR family transcriptional regulator